MLLVIDTNVLISGLLWRGPPHALLDKAREGTVDLVLSPALLKELVDVLAKAYMSCPPRSWTKPFPN